MKKNIVLVGFMGSGKTSVGKRLSMALKAEFIDMDDFIEKREKMTVTQIFAEKGEPYFRGLEKELCVRFATGGGKVIATGGGVVKDSVNVKNLKEGGVIFYLKSSPEKIAENLKDDHSRPLLETGDKADKIREMMREREHFYTRCCDVTIDAANKDPDSMAAEILSYIKETEK
ncbi:MAG: shikimate kinase [Firmicutes bacterium]|nr:shikimate kinase [Bacillota bacterium]